MNLFFLFRTTPLPLLKSYHKPIIIKQQLQYTHHHIQSPTWCSHHQKQRIIKNEVLKHILRLNTTIPLLLHLFIKQILVPKKCRMFSTTMEIATAKVIFEFIHFYNDCDLDQRNSRLSTMFDSTADNYTASWVSSTSSIPADQKIPPDHNSRHNSPTFEFSNWANELVSSKNFLIFDVLNDNLKS